MLPGDQGRTAVKIRHIKAISLRVGDHRCRWEELRRGGVSPPDAIVSYLYLVYVKYGGIYKIPSPLFFEAGGG